MSPTKTLVLMLALVQLLVVAARADDYFNINNMTDEEYYAMPQMHQMDEYYGCLASHGVYCLGSFELSAPPTNQLFHKLQRYSSDFVQHSNHTQLYRGVCLSRRCPFHENIRYNTYPQEDHAWFASCVNSSIMAEYNMSARLTHLDYCTREQQAAEFTTHDTVFVGLLSVLLALALISTAVDLTLSDHKKKDIGWAVSWSVRQSWRSLTAPVQSSTDVDLRFLDGLRVLSMLFVILLHTAGASTVYSVDDTRFYEQKVYVLMLRNSSLVVQVFFIISSFLMANKLLRQEHVPPVKTFIQTMLNRIIRISPSYVVTVCYAMSIHDHFGSGPLWALGVHTEVATCRRNWWKILLFMNNFNYTTKKCLGHTWSLAADMQLYAAGLVLMLFLRGRRALAMLAVLLVAGAVLPFALAYTWNLMPTYTLHTPDNLRREYGGNMSFNMLYQSPIGNAFASLMGLLLAHIHHALRGSKYYLSRNKVFQWVTMLAVPLLLVWAAIWPHLLAPGPPRRLGAALLATLERPVFCLLIALFMFGLLQGVDSRMLRMLSSRAVAVMARLSLGVLLMHFQINRTKLGSQAWPVHLNFYQICFEFFGVAAMSYTLAVLLALLVEQPAQRLYRELSGAGATRSTVKRSD